MNFIKTNIVKIIYYKGGKIARNLSVHIPIKSFNIENLGVPKVLSQEPIYEVRMHYIYLISNCMDEIEKNIYII